MFNSFAAQFTSGERDPGEPYRVSAMDRALLLGLESGFVNPLEEGENANADEAMSRREEK